MVIIIPWIDKGSKSLNFFHWHLILSDFIIIIITIMIINAIMEKQCDSDIRNDHFDYLHY